LQAGWTPFGDANTAAHWNDPRTRTSGAATVNVTVEGMREKLKIPDGVMLCVVKYPPKAPSEVAEQFHSTVQKLDSALSTSGIEYNVTGFLANMFYIRSDHGKAKELVLQTMAKERFEVEFH